MTTDTDERLCEYIALVMEAAQGNEEPLREWWRREYPGWSLVMVFPVASGEGE